MDGKSFDRFLPPFFPDLNSGDVAPTWDHDPIPDPETGDLSPHNTRFTVHRLPVGHSSRIRESRPSPSVSTLGMGSRLRSRVLSTSREWESGQGSPGPSPPVPTFGVVGDVGGRENVNDIRRSRPDPAPGGGVPGRYPSSKGDITSRWRREWKRGSEV